MPRLAQQNHALSAHRVRAWELRARGLQMRHEGIRVIDLSVGDPDVPTHQAVVASLHSALDQGYNHYPPIAGIGSLREALAVHAAQTFGVDVNADHVHVHLGAQNALYTALGVVLSPGDEAVLLEPCYPTYEPSVRLWGGVPVVVPAAQGFGLNLDNVKKAISSKTRCIFVNTPCNPSGVVLSSQEMQKLHALCVEHDLWLISDEVYGAIAPPDRYSSVLSLPDALDRVIYISSFSKSHGMTGWRLGWTIANENATNAMRNVASCATFGVSSFVQQAGVEAVHHMKEAASAMRQWCDQNRTMVVDALTSMQGIDFFDPGTGMFLMIDVRRTGMTSEEFCWRLLEEEHIATLDAQTFGDSLRGWVRVSCVADPVDLKEAMTRLARACVGWQMDRKAVG